MGSVNANMNISFMQNNRRGAWIEYLLAQDGANKGFVVDVSIAGTNDVLEQGYNNGIRR